MITATVVLIAMASTAPQEPRVAQWEYPKLSLGVEAKSNHLGLIWYMAPIAAHGLDYWTTRRNWRLGAIELGAGYGAGKDERRLLVVKGSVCLSQELTMLLLDRVLHNPSAAKVVASVSIWPAAAGGWNLVASIKW
jgi:hypothetical protein